MQTARDLIGVFIELSAGVKHGHNDFKGALVLFRHDIDRNTPAVILYTYRSVRVDDDDDMFTESG